MHLAIGDLVRDRTDQALDLVARTAVPATRRRNAARTVGFAFAALFAFVAGHSAREVGADWLLSFLAGVGGYSTAVSIVRWSARLASPRRFRV